MGFRQCLSLLTSLSFLMASVTTHSAATENSWVLKELQTDYKQAKTFKDLFTSADFDEEDTKAVMEHIETYRLDRKTLPTMAVKNNSLIFDFKNRKVEVEFLSYDTGSVKVNGKTFNFDDSTDLRSNIKRMEKVLDQNQSAGFTLFPQAYAQEELALLGAIGVILLVTWGVVKTKNKIKIAEWESKLKKCDKFDSEIAGFDLTSKKGKKNLKKLEGYIVKAKANIAAFKCKGSDFDSSGANKICARVEETTDCIAKVEKALAKIKNPAAPQGPDNSPTTK